MHPLPLEPARSAADAAAEACAAGEPCEGGGCQLPESRAAALEPEDMALESEDMAEAESWAAALEGRLQLWEPDRGLSDMAASLKNGSCIAIESLKPEAWQSCWAHAWRALMKNKAKLVDSSPERVDMLFTDMSFLHEVPVALLLERVVRYGLNLPARTVAPTQPYLTAPT